MISFIGAHQVAGICCAEKNEPYCFNCFYTFILHEMCLVFKSSTNSRHAAIIAVNPLVAGSILPDAKTVRDNEGIQFKGIILSPYTENSDIIEQYYRQYPEAYNIPGRCFLLSLIEIKFTSSVNGAVTKRTWQK